jgi:two-component system, NtrC family, sensor histidine kinase HydH
MRNKRIIVPMVVGILLLGISFSAAWYVLYLQQQNTHNLNVNVASIRAAEELELVVREMRHELDRYLLTHNTGHLERALKKRQEATDWLDEVARHTTVEREKDLIVSMRLGLENYFAQLKTIVENPTDQAAHEVIENLEEQVLSEEVLIAAHQFLDLSESRLEESDQENQAMAKILSVVMILLGIFGALIGFGTARAISRSMFLLAIPIRDVAGKLDTVVGPLQVSASPSLQDLQKVLETVSSRVGTVVEQLHDRRKEVIRVEQLAVVGKLGAGLAHELRNPLMCMKTLVQSARRDKTRAVLGAEDLAVLDEEISRVDSLLQTFLDFAKPAKFEPKQVDLAEVIQPTLDLVASRAQLRSITIDRAIQKDAGRVMGDANQLRQVLLNLLINAFDAVSDGGEISVTLNSAPGPETMGAKEAGRQNFDSDRCWAKLVVVDNGCGLPDERERLYEPFFSTKELGIGLGLPISKRIIDEHGGHLIAEDCIGGGAVFTVLLPTISNGKTGND